MAKTINKKNIYIAYILFLVTLFSLFLITSELTLRKVFHLGSPVIYQQHQDYGYRPKPNQELIRLKGNKVIINNLSLRNTQNWSDNKLNKILFVGDSVTYGGSYIDNNNLFTSLIENNLSGYKVGNAGVNGWGIKNMSGLVVEHQFQPAIIYISLLIKSDFLRGKSQSYGWSRQPYLALEELYIHYYKKWKTNFKNKPIQTPEKIKTNIKESIVALKKMDQTLKEKGYTHIIIYSPSKKEVENNIPINSIIQKELKKHNLIITSLRKDIKSAAKNTPLNTFYYDNVNLTQLGHKLWATLLTKKLHTHINNQ